MDLVIYERKTKIVNMIFYNAEIKADNVTAYKDYEMKYIDNANYCLSKDKNGKVLFNEKPKEKKNNIIYLDDYRKPY